MTPTTALGLSIRLSMFELRETGDWDIFLGPLERDRAETGGGDQWVLKRRECSGFARVNKVTSASLGYPLSVFNKNSTLNSSRMLPFPPMVDAVFITPKGAGSTGSSRIGVIGALIFFPHLRPSKINFESRVFVEN